MAWRRRRPGRRRDGRKRNRRRSEWRDPTTSSGGMSGSARAHAAIGGCDPGTTVRCGPTESPSPRSRTKETSMQDQPDMPLMDHELADDELDWMRTVYRDFDKARAAFAGPETAFNPKEALRDILGRAEHQLPT